MRILVDYVPGLRTGTRPEELTVEVELNTYSDLRKFCRFDVAQVTDLETGTHVWNNPLFKGRNAKEA